MQTALSWPYLFQPKGSALYRRLTAESEGKKVSPSMAQTIPSAVALPEVQASCNLWVICMAPVSVLC